MSNSNIFQQLCQACPDLVQQTFQNFARGAVRQILVEAMAHEVASLTGEKYHPTPANPHQRGGNAPGVFINHGEQEAIQRPRVRKKKSDGTTQEVPLQTYQAAQDATELQQEILRALAATSVSTRLRSFRRPCRQARALDRRSYCAKMSSSVLRPSAVLTTSGTSPGREYRANCEVPFR